MDGFQNPGEGFTPHVMNQLQQMASEPTSQGRGDRGGHRGRHRGRRGRSQYQRFEFDHEQTDPHVLSSVRDPIPTAALNMHQTPIQTSIASYHPPSGTTVPVPQHQYPQHPQQAQHSGHHKHHHRHHHHHQPQPQPSAEFHSREDHHGRYGGRSRGRVMPHNGNHDRAHSLYNDQTQGTQPAHGRLFNPGGNPYFGTADQQRAFRHKIMLQSDFLGTVASQALHNQISQEEFRAKETFRKVIQDIVRETIAANSGTTPKFDITNVKLRIYGSLGSGFGVSGSDMDLLLTFPQSNKLEDGLEIEARRWVEKALLEAGYGARLLTNTRVPILKVCERPSDELLNSLREYRQQWEDSTKKHTEPFVPDIDIAPLPPSLLADTDIVQELEKIAIQAVDIPLPDSVATDQVKLEFSGDCGIQCDINFTNFVALRNTELLKIYGQCDPRVRQVGLFVKHWAKARDINTPYKGTLSSYGYIMMVLHYLMNVVNPPVIPNLQLIAKDQDAYERRMEIETVEGFDVRFVRDPEQLQHIMAGIKPNHESLGSLLRGFFWYYACNGGFHWTRDVVSIRSHGGVISKYQKGWTGAKWSESKQNVRLRYLLAIEDPFETEHNIGRTVGHSGIVAIRDEFRRAWSIIENVQFEEARRIWVWSSGTDDEARDATELVERVDNRGDLLRKDQVAHKDRMRQMRKEAELKEQALQTEQNETHEHDHEITDALAAVNH